MCVVSLMVEQSQIQWGPISQWPLAEAKDVQKIIELLSSIDKKLGARDCYDPTKNEFLKNLAERVEYLEKFAPEPL